MAEEIEEGAVETFTSKKSEVTDTDDGGAIISMGEDENERPDKAWFDNIADTVDDPTKTTLATRLLEDLERDKKARERREKDYEEAIKRTGLGKESPGGADFE